MTIFNLLLFHVLFTFVLEQSEVFIRLLQSVMLAVEGMDHVVFLRVDLIFHI